MAGPWVWLPELKRYRDLATGRFLSDERVQSYVTDSMKASGSATDTLTKMLADKQVNLPGWQRAMRSEIREEIIRQYILGRGGLEQMTQVDWGSIGGMCADQFRYIDSFSDDIATGQFGAYMKVSLCNDGPATFILRTP